MNDQSAIPGLDALCRWCFDPIPPGARRDSIYCRKACRQAAHRFRAGQADAPLPGDDRPRHIAYADPPYPGKSHVYKGHPDYAGEVDHAALLERLRDEYPDGWALSTSAEALLELGRLAWALGITDLRVAAWHRGERPNRSRWPLNAWEPVLYRGGRQIIPDAGATRRIDSLVHHARARTTDPDHVKGAKPATFIWWMFDLLGLRLEDTLDDLYPGSGGIARAWKIVQEGPPAGPLDAWLVDRRATARA